MKKILFILLLLGNLCYGQAITITVGSTISSCPAGCCVLGIDNDVATLTAGHLYLFVVETTGQLPLTFSSGDGNPWDTLIQIGNATRNITIYKFMPTTSSSNDLLSIKWATATGALTKSYDITGVPIGNNGDNAIVQVVSSSGSASANPSITMAAVRNGNAVITFWLNDANPFSGTPESGWTENYDDGCVEVPSGYYSMQKIGGSDNTPTVTSGASTWIGLAIELRGGRRITIAN